MRIHVTLCIMFLICFNAYSASLKTKNIPVCENINEISVSGTGNLYLKQGNNKALVIETEESYFKSVNIDIHKGVFELSDNCKEEHESYFWGLFKKTKSTPEVNYYVTLPNISKIVKSGFGNTYIDKLNIPSLNIDLSGHGAFELKNLKTNNFTFIKNDFSNSYINFEPDNKINKVEINISGHGKVDFQNVNTASMTFRKRDFVNSKIEFSEECKLTDAKIDISGHGNADFLNMNTDSMFFIKNEFASSKLKFSNNCRISKVNINIKGHDKVKIYNMIVKKCIINQSGFSSLYITGKCNDQILELSGHGKYNGAKFPSDNVELKTSDFSSCIVNAINTIKQKQRSNVKIIGNPTQK